MCCSQGRRRSKQTARSIVIARVGGLQDLHVLGGEDVRGASEPPSHPPEEVVGGLVVRAAHDGELARVAVKDHEQAGEVPARLLEADDQRMLGHPVQTLQPDLDAGSRRVVVKDRRQADGLGDGDEVGGQLVLLG